MKENQEELDQEVTDTHPDPEIDMEAVEDSGVSEIEAEEFEIENLKAELEEMEDKYLRARAEIANLERALSTEVSDDQGASLKKGVEMVLESLRHALREEGIEKIPAKGEAFDPNLHQAVQTVPASEDVPADTIVEVLQEGYKLHDRVLRPTMVIVAQ